MSEELTGRAKELHDSLFTQGRTDEDLCRMVAAAEASITALRAALEQERERWEKALRMTWQMVDPLHPAGSPGSYARGQYTGIVAALTTLRENATLLSGRES